MTVIREDDFVQSVADALQFISYYHPLDYITALGAAYEREESPAAKDAIAQIAIHVSFLLSAIAIAYTDKIMMQTLTVGHAAKH